MLKTYISESTYLIIEIQIRVIWKKKGHDIWINIYNENDFDCISWGWG